MCVLLDRDPANTLPAGHNSRIDSGEDILFYYCQAGSVLAAGAGSSTVAWWSWVIH